MQHSTNTHTMTGCNQLCIKQRAKSEFMAKPWQEQSLKWKTGTLMANSIQHCCTRVLLLTSAPVHIVYHAIAMYHENNCCRCKSCAFCVEYTASCTLWNMIVFCPNVIDVHLKSCLREHVVRWFSLAECNQFGYFLLDTTKVFLFFYLYFFFFNHILSLTLVIFNAWLKTTGFCTTPLEFFPLYVNQNSVNQVLFGPNTIACDNSDDSIDSGMS